MQGLSLGPADLAADRRMKTTRVGGGHPGYLVRQDPEEGIEDEDRLSYQQDLWHYTLARMVGAVRSTQDLAALRPVWRYSRHRRLRRSVQKRLSLRLRRRMELAPRSDRYSEKRSLAPSRQKSPGRCESLKKWAMGPEQ